ncbi:hypothetical protein BT1A1_2379 [Caldibacillus thermoamylovorans]|uniref:Ribonuclease n=1 Tax=Caldibacillus thermoamylovorans TaxID=35841 RepID=A0A090KU00_9BACI|nr:ribonuclease domain-containing protein [Caldibacillus thermoamylovorans]CEE02199.1 hypothetical protein BT1A1_2379 [Caldibacillus thermoamylovorans]
MNYGLLLEPVGWNDVQRVFSEYDPVTGEKLSFGDRLLAGGFLALSLLLPAKAVGVGGKMLIKGADAGIPALAKTPGVLKKIRNVLDPKKFQQAFRSVYDQVVNAPIALTKVWFDTIKKKIGEIRLPQVAQEAYAGIGAAERTVKDAFSDAKDLIQRIKNTKLDELDVGEAGGATKGTGKFGADNIALHAKYKEILKATESANPLIDSLKQTGKLPSNYVNKDVAALNGWKPGKPLNNYVSGGQLGGDVFKNTTNVVPNAPGRVWYEADIGLNNTIARSKQPGSRLLYSNDGQMYITTDHYKTVHFIGTYK